MKRVKKALLAVLLLALLLPTMPVLIALAANYDDGSATYVGSWSHFSSGSTYNNTYSITTGISDYFTFTFTGVSIDLVAYKFTDKGLMDIYIDNVYQTTVDENDTLQWQVVIYSSGALSYGSHTLKGVYASGGSSVDVDEFIVDETTPTPTITPSPTNTSTPTFTPTVTNTPTPTNTPVDTDTPTPTPTNTFTPTATYTPGGPTLTPSPTFTSTPPPVPTEEPPPVGGGGGAGGGSYLHFPWQAGAFVVYGPRGVHGQGDYGTSGMIAIDFVSGSDFGPGAASDQVFAANDGTIDYVCRDDISVAIRTHNSTIGEYFIYAHLKDNDNLHVGTAFKQDELIGSLVHGTFNDTCGWAEQRSTQWHVHFMFKPASGSFKIEGCRLTVSTEKWDCDGNLVGTGQYLYGGGGSSSATGTDDAGGLGTASGGVADTQASFWDYFLGGIINIVNVIFVNQLPDHGSSQIIYVFYNTLNITIRLMRVLVYENINLYPLIAAIGYAIGINLAFGIGWLAAFVLKAWKSLVPLLGA